MDLKRVTHHTNVDERTSKEKFVRKYLWPELPLAYNMSNWGRRDRLLKHFFPIRYFLFETVPHWYGHTIKYPIYNAKEWVRFRTIDKYHILKIDHKPGYRDPDDILLASSFQVLVDFIEIEMAAAGSYNAKGVGKFRTTYRWRRRLNKRDGQLGIDTIRGMKENNPMYGPMYETIIDLYEWWVFERPLRITFGEDDVGCLVAKAHGLNSPDYFGAMNKIEDFYYKEDSAMIAKLSSVRARLWY